MKKLVLLFVLSILVLNVFSQSEYNRYDAAGQRDGVWKKRYANGNVRYVGQFSHGKEIGIFKYYAITGEEKPIVTKEFIEGSDLVDVKFYTKKGKLESKGKMKDKKRTGKWMYYFSDGKTLMSTEEYKDGLLNGEVKIFYKSGQLTELSHYKNGKREGTTKRYSDVGKVTEDLTYKNGIMDGPATIYNEKGEIFARGNYENGIKTGVWEFNMDGEMVKSNPEKIPHIK